MPIVAQPVTDPQGQFRIFYEKVILKAYKDCEVRDEPKHLWIRFEDEKENYSYYQFPLTENPIGYKTRLTKEGNPKSRETTGDAIALFDLLPELSTKRGNGVTFTPSCPPNLPIADRFNGSRIVNFEIDGKSFDYQWGLNTEMVAVGLKPTAIVNSGNQSLHICFVLSENLTPDQFRYLKRSFLPFGADQNVANSLIGGMRFPCVIRQSTGKQQTLESCNDVTYSFTELTRLIELFYLSKDLEFESFEKYQARQEIESEKLQKEPFIHKDYDGSDIENLLIEWDGLFPRYQSGNRTYNYRKNIAIAVASMGLGDKAKELCPNLFGDTNLKFSSLEKTKFVNPLGCILSQSREWLNDSHLQFPDWWREKYNRKQFDQDKIQTLLNTIKKEENLGDRLSQLLDKKDDLSIILMASIELASEFEDPIEEVTKWVDNDFKSLHKAKIWRAIEIIAAIASKWGDKARNAFLCQSIKNETGLPRIDEIRSAFRNINSDLNPQKTDKEIKFSFIESRIKNLRFNELTKKVERKGEEYKNIELAYISDDLRDSDLEISKDFAVDSILSIALKDSYHPVKNYLESVKDVSNLSDHEWDNLASILLGCNDPLAQIVLKKSLIAAVARIYQPGCYVRMVAVLQGGQNKGKSTFLRLLAGENFFCDSLGKLDNPKDDYQLLHSYWIHEWSEIDKLNKKSSGDQKAFITKMKDDYRAPYARSPETHLRQCVIFGTCNRTDFLQDATGNTRYSVIPIGDIDLEKTKEWRDRIWATAKAKFEAGEVWQLTGLEGVLSEKNNQNYADVDPWFETISLFIHGKYEVSVNEILDKLEVDMNKQDKLSSKRVRDCLMILGWEQDKNATNRAGVRVRRYRPVLSQSSQQSDTVRDTVHDEVCQPCVNTVSGESLTGTGLQHLDTLDTLKSKEKNPPQLNANTIQNDYPRDLAGNNIGKECVNCVSTIETYTHQGIEADTVVDTMNVLGGVLDWETAKKRHKKAALQLGWSKEESLTWLFKNFGVDKSSDLSDEQYLEMLAKLEALAQSQNRDSENRAKAS